MGVVWGGINAAAPLGFWWLDPATVYALSLTLIAAVYIGFAVADGRPTVIAVEAVIAAVFVVVAKDLWQHRRQYVANTRWWPPFCLVIDWVASAILVRSARRRRRLPPPQRRADVGCRSSEGQ